MSVFGQDTQYPPALPMATGRRLPLLPHKLQFKGIRGFLAVGGMWGVFRGYGYGGVDG